MSLDTVISEINGTTKLSFDTTDGKAETKREGDIRKVTLTTGTQTGDSSWIDLSLQLGHEAYRDGVKSDEQTQKLETQAAVMGHTTMAQAMLGDQLYANAMLSYIAGNQNIQNDLSNYYQVMALKDSNIFNNYVNENYDSSADYWKVLHDGNVVWDGELDLYDENGQLLHHTDKTSYTKALAEHLGITETEATELMVQAGYEKFVSGENGQPGYFVDANGQKVTEKNKIQTSEKFKASYDLQVNYADKVGTNYVNMKSAFESYQNDMNSGKNLTGTLGDYLLTGEFTEQLLGFSSYSTDYDNYMTNYYNSEKNTQYNSKEAYYYLEKIQEDVFGQKVTNNSLGYEAFGPTGVLNPVGNENTTISTRAKYDSGKMKDQTHLFGEPKGFSVDITRSVEYRLLGLSIEGSPIYTNTNSWLYGDSVFDNPTGTSYGSEVRLYGNNSTYIYGHLQDNSIARIALKNLTASTAKNALWRTYLPAATQIGNLGNTGNSTGPHLHWEYRKGYQR